MSEQGALTMEDGIEAAQRLINTRAIEIAQEALTAQRYHEREDTLRFEIAGKQIEALAEGQSKLVDKMDADKSEIIGAIQTLRTATYGRWDRYKDRIIYGLIVLAVSLGAYAFHLATGK